MELTREEAIRLHRELWGWLAENPMKKKEDWPKWKESERIQHDCFCCEFVKYDMDIDNCKRCPLEWKQLRKLSQPPCECSYFNKWHSARLPEERSRLAAIIRDLPEKGEKKEPAPEFKIGNWVKVVYAGYGFSEGNTYIPESQRPNLPYKSPFDGESYEIIAISTKPDKWYGFIYLLKSKENTICCMHYKYMNNTNEPVGFELTTPPPRFAVGDKVVPVSKSIHCSLEECVAWNNAKRKGQSFLYVALIDHNGDICCHENYPKTSMAYNFKESDLIPYVEPEKKPEPKAMFKVGDRIKSICYHPGKEGTVVEIDGTWIGIEADTPFNNKSTEWDNKYPNKKGKGWYDLSANIEIIKPKAFKVGDRVRVRKDLIPGQIYGDLHFHPGNMAKQSGYEGIIEHASNHYKISGLLYGWSAEMLELLPPANHCPEPKTFTEYGATFIFRDNVTVCIVEIDGQKFKGIAKCRPEDTWNETVGKGWAGTRALRKLIEATEAQLKAL